MKKYIGTKIVMAEPLTMGEAYEMHLLQTGRIPTFDERKNKGYFVKYDNGYESWSPADVFEKNYKEYDSYISRMCVELNEESERCERGAKFINSGEFKKLSYSERMLLMAQNETQSEYCILLHERTIQSLMPSEKRGKIDSGARFSFGVAVKILKAGGAVRRSKWNNNGDFIIKQIPANIAESVIPHMTSLPQIAKDILMNRREPRIDYNNQMLIIHKDGKADSWTPSSSDVFACDWCLVTE